VDLLLHLGHAKLGEPGEKVVFMEARMGADLRHAVERAVPLLKEKRVGLTTTVQHLHKLGEALAALRDHGVEGVVGPACGRAGHPGQVLGCCYCSARGADVREHLFIGTGQFHPLGVALATGKRVVAADPITGEALEVDPKPMLRRRFASIARAKDAKRVAVLVSKKPGQMRWDLARRLKEMGEAGGMEMHLVYMENIEPERLLNLGIEAAVFTACPRVALDDSAKFGIPVLTPPEFEILLGEREDYSFDEMEGNLGGG
jgi:2-(3-amino-3-carboxypropyl)histidine synthase